MVIWRKYYILACVPVSWVVIVFDGENRRKRQRCDHRSLFPSPSRITSRFLRRLEGVAWRIVVSHCVRVLWNAMRNIYLEVSDGLHPFTRESFYRNNPEHNQYLLVLLSSLNVTDWDGRISYCVEYYIIKLSRRHCCGLRRNYNVLFLITTAIVTSAYDWTLHAVLTHGGRVIQLCIRDSKLGHHWFGKRLFASPAPSHHLNQWWIIVN